VVAAIIGVALDLGAFGVKLPGPRRQVNEQWLDVYRGWVYGIGFGFQLGLGIVTIVGSSAIYVAFLAAFLTADPRAAVVIGVTFATLRGSSVLLVARVRRPERLLLLGRRLSHLESAARSMGIVVQVATAVASVLAVMLMS